MFAVLYSNRYVNIMPISTIYSVQNIYYIVSNRAKFGKAEKIVVNNHLQECFNNLDNLNRIISRVV